MLDLDQMLQSISDDAPSGEDLEYDPAFTELEMANQPGEERVIGDAVIPAEDPDYGQVADLAIALLDRTKDLRVAVILANAVLATEGLTAFEVVLQYMRRSVEEHWDSVHPQLDEEDDDDPTMRVNAILGLTNRDTVLKALRLAPLTDSRSFGQFSLRDMEVASGDIPAPDDMDTVPAMQTVSAAFQDEGPEKIAERMAAIVAMEEHIKAISDTFDEHVGTLGPDLSPLSKMIYDIRKRLSVYTDSAAPEDTSNDPATSDTPVQAAVTHLPGLVSSPNDVINALDRIVEYYTRNEPSSPVPILLNRAKRLVSADFVTIMKDMAPLGVENVALIGGLPSDEDDDYD
ncbi:type VI secretion system protein TssA [Cognatiyoonia sp. IB215446]|uniref:type VI secretion system protein TssA n=1 Tax=Cognatiyoonia sp. IB215446 TaxID=3097355 RepID=UPI002A17F914|nr:type VI secretion system protein TssA [Cognatiyoonia sp. IB215446]MDX8346887.1 type VI secretion system protein TssA [Cognatiyoonia sp. IB215446]